jgi:hypothetical protein
MNPVIHARPGTLPAGHSPARPADGTAEIASLIIADHKRILRLFHALDGVARVDDAALTRPWLSQLWARLSDLLELHSSAEEEICYPVLFGRGERIAAMLDAAIADHDDIREVISEARLCDTGTVQWWRAVTAARQAFTAHFSHEEEELLAEICGCLEPEAGTILARQWAAFATAAGNR